MFILNGTIYKTKRIAFVYKTTNNVVNSDDITVIQSNTKKRIGSIFQNWECDGITHTPTSISQRNFFAKNGDVALTFEIFRFSRERGISWRFHFWNRSILLFASSREGAFYFDLSRRIDGGDFASSLERWLWGTHLCPHRYFWIFCILAREGVMVVRTCTL